MYLAVHLLFTAAFVAVGRTSMRTRKRLTPTNDQGRFGYLRGAEPRRGRRTVLTFPLPPPPQKN